MPTAGGIGKAAVDRKTLMQSAGYPPMETLRKRQNLTSKNKVKNLCSDPPRWIIRQDMPAWILPGSPFATSWCYIWGPKYLQPALSNVMNGYQWKLAPSVWRDHTTIGGRRQTPQLRNLDAYQFRNDEIKTRNGYYFFRSESSRMSWRITCIH